MKKWAPLLIIVTAFTVGIGVGIASTSLIEPPRHVHIAIRGESIAQQGGIIELKKE